MASRFSKGTGNEEPRITEADSPEMLSNEQLEHGTLSQPFTTNPNTHNGNLFGILAEPQPAKSWLSSSFLVSVPQQVYRYIVESVFGVPTFFTCFK